GLLPSTSALMKSSRSSSPQKLAVLVLCKSIASARKRSTSGQRSPSDPKPNMKRFKPPAVGNRDEPLPKSMGIEATISQGVRAFGMGRSSYIGLAKTHLQHLGIAAAINLVRALAWLDGDELAPTPLSAFQRLYSTA